MVLPFANIDSLFAFEGIVADTIFGIVAKAAAPAVDLNRKLRLERFMLYVFLLKRTKSRKNKYIIKVIE